MNAAQNGTKLLSFLPFMNLLRGIKQDALEKGQWPTKSSFFTSSSSVMGQR